MAFGMIALIAWVAGFYCMTLYILLTHDALSTFILAIAGILVWPLYVVDLIRYWCSVGYITHSWIERHKWKRHYI